MKEEKVNPDPLLKVKRDIAMMRPKIKTNVKKIPGEVIIKKPEEVKEVLKSIVADKVINKVDLNTGEIKESKVIKFDFIELDRMDKVENYIYTNGKQFAVLKYFASIKKYAIVDTLDEAREILNSIK